MTRTVFIFIAAMLVSNHASAQVAGQKNCPADIHQTLYGASFGVLDGSIHPERAFIFARKAIQSCAQDRGVASLIIPVFLAVAAKVTVEDHKTEALTLGYQAGHLASSMGPLPDLAVRKADGSETTWTEWSEHTTWGNLMAAIYSHHQLSAAFPTLYGLDSSQQPGCGLSPIAEAGIYSDGALLPPGLSTPKEFETAGFRLQWLVSNCEGPAKELSGYAAKFFEGMAQSEVTYRSGDPLFTMGFAKTYLKAHLGDRNESLIWPADQARRLLGQSGN